MYIWYIQCYLGNTRNRYDDSNCVFNTILNCLCIGQVLTRNIIREGYGISGNCLGDCCTVCCCPCCVGIQLSAEVKHRGRK